MTDKPKGQPEITQTKAAQPTEQLESQSDEQADGQISDEQLEATVGGRSAHKRPLDQLDNQTIAQPESSDDFRQGPPQKDWHY